MLEYKVLSHLVVENVWKLKILYFKIYFATWTYKLIGIHTKVKYSSVIFNFLSELYLELKIKSIQKTVEK